MNIDNICLRIGNPKLHLGVQQDFVCLFKHATFEKDMCLNSFVFFANGWSTSIQYLINIG